MQHTTHPISYLLGISLVGWWFQIHQNQPPRFLLNPIWDPVCIDHLLDPASFTTAVKELDSPAVHIDTNIDLQSCQSIDIDHILQKLTHFRLRMPFSIFERKA